ncbi:hypothetical protein [Micromonospora inyonensis]|uniref:Winged helix DNA-binding domain-containing protein n=1 Tax=Micromonospora inyonensis TaxID=47866 RepID=A0A1C6RDQ5_9ACTN|nr:hypothetical protein [Micromonospora inyonensis]SCL15094.1 hypothetical protein GA0074694_1050 [Micromonospora inyonensis]SCL33490.1 hypothetical protein GA0074694_6239 [Micromonospora inyonensis]
MTHNPNSTIGDTLMQTTLGPEHVELLVAIRQGRVHSDPRYTRPDFEKLPDPPFGLRRAGRRLGPLMAARLVRLAEDADDRDGVRLYQLTERGEEVLAEALRQEAAANADDTTAVIGAGVPAGSAGA